MKLGKKKRDEYCSRIFSSSSAFHLRLLTQGQTLSHIIISFFTEIDNQFIIENQVLKREAGSKSVSFLSSSFILLSEGRGKLLPLASLLLRQLTSKKGEASVDVISS